MLPCSLSELRRGKEADAEAGNRLAAGRIALAFFGCLATQALANDASHGVKNFSALAALVRIMTLIFESFSAARLSQRVSILTLGLLGLTLSGCATLPISGPTAGRIANDAKSEKNTLGFKITEFTPASLADESAPVPTASLGELAVGSVSQPVNIIRAGDSLTISIFEVGFSLFGGAMPLDARVENATANAQRVGIRVDDQGRISLPYIGTLGVSGLTPEQLERAIEGRLLGLSQSPQAMVAIADSIANSVYVSGTIARPGRVPLTSARERVLDLVALAGGPTTDVDNVELRLVRNGRSAETRLGALRAEAADNIELAPGDRIELANKPRTFTVFGASDRVSQIPFGAGDVTLADALARAGGPSDNRADPKGVFLFRFVRRPDNSEEPVIYRINLMTPESYFLAQRFAMQDKDLLYFSNSPSNLPTKFISVLNQLFSPVVTARFLTQN